VDDDLLARLLAREPAAWEALLAEHGGMIEATCRRTLLHAGQSPGEASDAAAEVFRALLDNEGQALRRFRPGASLGAYLRVIARHRTIERCRRKSPAGLPWLDLPSGGGTPLARLEAAERQEHLREALAALPAREGLILRLFHLEALSYREIAGRAGIPAEQVGVLLLRARARLKEALGRDFPEFL
jgi:RNA polymerase sigma-70 factor (ECF subfamily)